MSLPSMFHLGRVSMGRPVREASPPRPLRWLAESASLGLSDRGRSCSSGWWPGWRSGPVGHHQLLVPAHRPPPCGPFQTQLATQRITSSRLTAEPRSSTCEGRVLQKETQPSGIPSPWQCSVGRKQAPGMPTRKGWGGRFATMETMRVTFRHVCHNELNKLIYIV